MIRAQQRAAIRNFVGLAVAKEDSAFRFQLSASFHIIQVSVEGDLAQHDHYFYIGERGKFAIEKCCAIPNLFR